MVCSIPSIHLVLLLLKPVGCCCGFFNSSHNHKERWMKTSHGGGRRAENWRSFSSKVLAFSVPNATRLAAVPGTPHKYKKSSWKASCWQKPKHPQTISWTVQSFVSKPRERGDHLRGAP